MQDCNGSDRGKKNNSSFHKGSWRGIRSERIRSNIRMSKKVDYNNSFDLIGSIKTKMLNSRLLEKTLKRKPVKWHNFDFKLLEKQIKTQQFLIAGLYLRGDFQGLKRAQQSLISDIGASILAVKRVTSSSGGKTSGVDGLLWNTPELKLKAVKKVWNTVQHLDEYKSKPILRVWIDKSNSTEKRPLGIPTIEDRAIQYIYLLAMEPIEESRSDEHSYGFRPFRGTSGAITRIRHILDKRSAENFYILDADISQCFDKISHQSILSRAVVPNKSPLREWLNAPVAERKFKVFDKKMKHYGRRTNTSAKKQALPKIDFKYDLSHRTGVTNKCGTPQGGVISPLLCNMVLNGMEKVISKINARSWVKRKLRKDYHTRSKLHLIRYADDFLIIGPNKESINLAKTAISVFLKKRGLELSREKTKLVKVTNGFDFLGWNIRRQPINSRENQIKPKQISPRIKAVDSLLIIQPSTSNKKSVRKKLNQIYKSSYNKPLDQVFKQINPVLLGWANYYAISKNSLPALKSLNQHNERRFLKYLMRKHNRGLEWVFKNILNKETTIMYEGKKRKTVFLAKFWEKSFEQPWMFNPTLVNFKWMSQNKEGQNIFTPEGRTYWEGRKFQVGGGLTEFKQSIYEKYNWKCGHCGAHLATDSQANSWIGGSAEMKHLEVEIHHHRTPRWAGGANTSDNLMPVHKSCHPQAQQVTDKGICAKWNLYNTGDNRHLVAILEESERKKIARMTPLDSTIYTDGE